MTAEPKRYRYTFTVFTPTYNRVCTLPRVYESLQAQTYRDFEWLIIDDGSTDGTGDLVRLWQKEAPFPIRYYWQENTGKMPTSNRGVQLAEGELFLNLDSDDGCVPHALERLKHHWDTIPDAERPGFSAVTVLCVDEHGGLVGDRFPHDVVDSDFLEMRYRFKIRGEKWGFQRTDVMKEFPFPMIEGEGVIPLSMAWSQIARKYRTRYANEPLRIYFIADRGSSIRRWRRAVERAKGMMLWHQSILNNDIGWFRYAPEEFLRSALHYSRFALHSGRGIAEQRRKLTSSLAKALWLLTLPLGGLLYLRDRARLRRSP